MRGILKRGKTRNRCYRNSGILKIGKTRNRNPVIDEMALASVIWWRIWFLCNQMVHGTTQPNYDLVYAWSVEFLSGYRAANCKDVSGKSLNGVWGC